MRFVDLFAGLGGFHIALRRLGHECVFACEIDPTLRALYQKNLGLAPSGDIRQVAVTDIPNHDVLCAGFPCQPFSKAGEQQGFADPESGDLFDFTLKILRYRTPRYFILENVPNLEKHDQGRTWKSIEQQLLNAGYYIRYRCLSPHRFGIPQVRQRLFIVGSRTDLADFSWPAGDSSIEPSILRPLDQNPPEARPLSAQVQKCLEVWQEFLERFPVEQKLPSFPIWSMEFGATYPFKDTTPHQIGLDALRRYSGSHGRSLASLPEEQLMGCLPSHARRQQFQFPRWKVNFIRQNRQLYERNRDWLDEWIPKIMPFPSSLQKLEWNCSSGDRNIWKYVIQFRASGVRVKRATTSPSLVAMTDTQVPIIGWERRYMTPRECARLQSLGDDGFPNLPEPRAAAFAALGNAVNADLVEKIAVQLLEELGAAQPRETTDVTREWVPKGDVLLPAERTNAY